MLPCTSSRTRRSSLVIFVTPATPLRSGTGPSNCELDRTRAEVAHLAECAEVDETAGAKDADPPAQRLDLREDVRGEEHGLAPVAMLR